MIGSMAKENSPKAACAVKPFRPRPSQLEKRVRELAMDSKNVAWKAETHTTHTESRMEWRDITDTMMFDVL